MTGLILYEKWNHNSTLNLKQTNQTKKKQKPAYLCLALLFLYGSNHPGKATSPEAEP